MRVFVSGIDSIIATVERKCFNVNVYLDGPLSVFYIVGILRLAYS